MAGETVNQSAPGPRAAGIADYIKLARPHQWAKCAFVVIGPIYATAGTGGVASWIAVIFAAIGFGLASSACYVVNDIGDREADRLHPRKSKRPIAAGVVSVPAARVYAVVLLILAAACPAAPALTGDLRGAGWLALMLALYVGNTMVYSAGLKRVVIVDVISLAGGFVLRVLGGCAAALVEPSTWLLNCTFFVSMFLAFGKRLGERRTMGDDAAGVRGVQVAYTDDLLRMAVVVTAVGTLSTYAGYVQAQAALYTPHGIGFGFNLLWLTVLPATYALFRCILLLERGWYDDPTELAAHDRPFQLAAGIFALMTAVLMSAFRWSQPSV